MYSGPLDRKAYVHVTYYIGIYIIDYIKKSQHPAFICTQSGEVSHTLHYHEDYVNMILIRKY